MPVNYSLIVSRDFAGLWLLADLLSARPAIVGRAAFFTAAAIAGLMALQKCKFTFFFHLRDNQFCFCSLFCGDSLTDDDDDDDDDDGERQLHGLLLLLLDTTRHTHT